MPGFNIKTGDGPSNTQEFLRQNRWRIKQLGPVTDQDVVLFARDLNLPEYRIDQQEILGGLLYYKFAKSVKWQDVQVTLYDINKTLDELIKWRDQVYTNAAGIQVHSTYKKDSIFELLDGNGSPLKKITLKNSWPVSIAQGQLTYTSSEVKLITITLAYDFAEAE
jgi:hypothetical protein